jgi:serine/threonine-protein kinase
MTAKKTAADPHPAAKALLDLRSLLAVPATAERHAAAWRLVTAACGHPDFHAVLDFATENELVAACQAADPGAPAATWTNPADGSEMVWIPGGPFKVGADDQDATCDGFSLARRPVTNAQFHRFVSEAGYAPPPEHPDNDGFLSHWSGKKPPAALAKHPVVWVSLYDALAYCRWAGAALPSEWLWEKSARGPDGRPHPWGDAGPLANPKKKLAHVATDATAAVGGYSGVRSPYGCEELVGNVSEWCQPVPDDAPRGQFPLAPPDLPIPASGEQVRAVVRGACFLRAGPAAMKSAHRRQLSVTRRNRWTGFRTAVLLPCRPLA